MNKRVPYFLFWEVIECQKFDLNMLACYPSSMIHHILDSTKDGRNGDFMYCHSSMASKQLLQLRKTNILLAEELKLAEMSEENLKYSQIPQEEQCEGNHDIIKSSLP